MMNSMMTVVENVVAKFGKENIFMIKEDYHGLYEDDHCNFEYYNNVTGEIFEDGWTTAAACPSYDRYIVTHIKDVINTDVIDIQKFLNCIKNRFKISGDNFKLYIEDVAEYGLRVEVNGGRKWKGIGYLIGLEEKSYQYYNPMFAAHSSYGKNITKIAKIYDPLTGKIERVTAKYVNFIDEQQIDHDYVEMYNKIVDNISVKDLVFMRAGVNFNEKIFVPFIQYIKEHYSNVNTNMLNAYDEVQIERIRKSQEYRERKMKDIMNWVIEKTNKTGVEAIELAERIYDKNNRII